MGVFFVWKKGREKMRVILDARRTNRRFIPSPPVSLVTAEGFAGIGIDGDGGGDAHAAVSADFSLAIADVQNCFHYLKIGVDYGQYFCYPYQVTAREMGLVGTMLNRQASWTSRLFLAMCQLIAHGAFVVFILLPAWH